jgi:NhaP-type Na+/H+ or K+/H+ antiporter
VTGLLEPDWIFGSLLFPAVSLAAALVLFEGGLSASWEEIRTVASPVRRLVTVGVCASWLMIAAAAGAFLGLDAGLSLLLGAILVVTGPTVIGPLLRQVRPRGRVGSILKLEGIINDPIGAVLAIVVFQAIRAEQVTHAFRVVALGVATSLVAGVALGVAGALLLLMLLRRGLLPPYLKNAVSLAVVLLVFAVTNAIKAESGLIAVTVMGVSLASQRRVSIKPIADFHEHLRVVIISALFIVLAARIDFSDLAALPVGTVAFLVATILLVRPAMVWLSTLGTDVGARERLFLAAIAPRGIVAAAVASVFGLRLAALGYAHADRIMAATFLVIVATVAVAGLAAAPLARWLGLRQRDPQGVLFLGADRLPRAVASAVAAAGFRVVLVDSNATQVEQARREGLSAVHGSLLSEQVLNRIDLDGLGRLMAMTSNDEANSLAVIHFRDVFGDEVYQTRPAVPSAAGAPRVAMHLRGKFLAEEATYSELAGRLARGARVEVTRLDDERSYAALRARHGADAIPLCVITAQGDLHVVSSVEREPEPGDRVVSLVGGASARTRGAPAG